MKYLFSFMSPTKFNPNSQQARIQAAVFAVIVMLVVSMASGCSEGDSTEQEQGLIDIEICLDQGGEWVDNQCSYSEKETCLIMSGDGVRCLSKD